MADETVGALLVFAGLLMFVFAIAIFTLSPSIFNGTPKFNILLHANAAYNPLICSYTQCWFIDGITSQITPASILDGIFGRAFSIGNTGNVILKADLMQGRTTIAHQEASIGEFSQLTGGSGGADLTFKGIEAGSYTVRWTLYENGALRRAESQTVVVG